MLVNSFKSNTEIMSNPAGLPIQWTLASYADVVSPERSLLRNMFNSVIIAGSSTALAVLFSAAAGLCLRQAPLSRARPLFGLLLMTMMVPPEVVVPGQFILFARLGWINTLQVQILPEITPILGLFLIRQYMMTIPDELIDAARVDGAGPADDLPAHHPAGLEPGAERLRDPAFPACLERLSLADPGRDPGFREADHGGAAGARGSA